MFHQLCNISLANPHGISIFSILLFGDHCGHLYQYYTNIVPEECSENTDVEGFSILQIFYTLFVYKRLACIMPNLNNANNLSFSWL